MRKLLFTFLALMVLGTSAWATTISKETKNMGWTAGKTYQSFNLDDVILITTTGKGSSYSNGYFTNNNWYMYYNTGTSTNGPITISAKRGYKIDSYSLTYSPNGNATLSKVKGNSVATSNQIASGSTYNVNAQSTTIYVGDKSTATSSIVKVTKFTVTYSKVDPTSIALSDMTISVGNTFQLLPTPTPANACPSYTWSSDNTDVVSFDSNGILTAKKAGSANVTITSYNSKKATCKITVEDKNYKSFTDTIKSYTTGSSYVGMSSVESVTGDGGVLNWIMRGVRRYTDDKVNNVQWTRICFNTTEDYLGKNYIAYNNSKGLPAEGGVKRVSFQWKAANGTNPVAFDVDNTGTPSPWITYKTYLNGNNAWKNVSTYTRDVNMDKNVQFRISLTANEAAVITISPITITPYLLFTNKAVTATNGFYKYNDNDLINNTGENPTITVNDANAASVDEDGTVRSLQDGKTVTVTAKWGDVTTTTKLTTKLVDPTAKFASAVVSKQIGDTNFTNTFTKTTGGAVTYSSSNEDVATVNADGEVTIVNGGTAQIIATVAASAPYKAKEFAYTLDVAHTPTEPYFAESFDSIQVGTSVSLDAPKVFGGNGGVYRWQWKNTQRLSDEKIGTYQSPKLMNNYGEIAMVDVVEGGIKEVAFRYRAKGTTLPIHFFVKVGDKVVEMQRPKSSDTFNFAHQFNMADSVGLSIYLGATETPTQQTHILLDTVKIVPYLLYTQKVATASKEDSVPYTNINLINNTGVKPSYSISCGSDVATIDENGAVTIYKADTVTVTATWGKVKTTYTLQMQAKQIPEISFAEESPNKDLLAGEFTNALTTPVGIGDTTYTSSNEDIATVDAAGKVTMHSIGQTTITVNIAENDNYAATSKSYTLTVGFNPATGTYWTETYSKVPAVKNYNGTDKYMGDSSVYNWAMTYYQRQSDDMVGTYQGTRIRYSGALAMDGVQEGGVKAVRFDYRAANQADSIHFKVNVGNTDYEYKHDAITVKGTIVSYARKFEVKKNTQFSINMDAKKDPQQGYPIVGPITITPYLLYTVKSMEKKQEEGSFTNTALINNAEGDVVYSVEGENASQIASINASTGEVTILGEGVVTVKATWGDVFTTYTLIAHTKTLPNISFAADTISKDMLDAAFTNVLTTTAGVGDTTYISSNEKVATVAANGEVTIVGVGQTIITANIAENATFAAASASYALNVGFTPQEGTFWKETFSKRNPKSSKNMNPIATVGDSTIYNWTLTNYDINNTDNFDGVIGVRVRYDGSIVNEFMEGGVKALAFDWRASNNTNYIHYKVIAGTDTTVFDSDPIPSSVTNRFTFARRYEQKSNSTFTFTIDTAGQKNTLAFLGISPITITPYLLYTTKKDTLDMKDSHSYKMVPQIDNRDNEDAIQYSFVEENVTCATISSTTGEVTALAGGVVTVKAAWGDVYTTYQLTILNDKSTIYLMRNDGTENADTIVNNCGEAMPTTVQQPTRDGYRFNAYFTSPDTSVIDGYRFTVTRLDGKTVWVGTRQIGKDKFTDKDRKWIYQGASYTFYAQWMPELAIVLNNQDATEPGTEQVITAYCPNNNFVNLMNSDIEIPAKTGFTFGGYFTEAEGQGIKLIDAEGSFIASVAGPTGQKGDTILNQYKMWSKDQGMTLYAYWVENALTIDEEDTELAQKVADNDGKSANVTLKRAMTADGTYNTIYLPFALTEEQVTAVFGVDAKVAELKSSTKEGNVLSLNFDFVTATEAGKPYLVAPTKDVTEVNVGQVAISKEEQIGTCEGGNFHGILEKQSIVMSGKYFLGNENKLITYTAITNYTTKGLRAYFTLNNPAPGVQARCVIGRSTTTVLPFINGEAVSGTKKIIIDSRLVIIRDGMMFNAQGARLK